MSHIQTTLAATAATSLTPTTLAKDNKDSVTTKQSLMQTTNDPIDTLILIIKQNTTQLDEKTKEDLKILKSNQKKLSFLNQNHKNSINLSLQAIQKIEYQKNTLSDNSYITAIQQAMFQALFKCQKIILVNIELRKELTNIINCLTIHILKKDQIQNSKKRIKENPLNKEEQEFMQIIKQEFKKIFLTDDTFKKLLKNPLFYKFINKTFLLYVPYVWLIHTQATKEQETLFIENIKKQKLTLNYEIAYELYVNNPTNPDYKELFDTIRQKARTELTPTIQTEIAKTELTHTKQKEIAISIECKLDHIFINSPKILKEDHLKSVINLNHLDTRFLRTVTLPTSICIKNVMNYTEKKLIETNPKKKDHFTLSKDWETYKQNKRSLPDSIINNFIHTTTYTKDEKIIINTILTDYNKLLRYDLYQTIPTGEIIPLIKDYDARGMIDFFIQVYIDTLEPKIYNMFLDHIDLFKINKPDNYEILNEKRKLEILEKENNVIKFFEKLTYEECHKLLTKKDDNETTQPSIWQKIYTLFPNRTFYIKSNLTALFQNSSFSTINPITKNAITLLSLTEKKETKKPKNKKKKKSTQSNITFELSKENYIKTNQLLETLTIKQLHLLKEEITHWIPLLEKNKSVPIIKEIEKKELKIKETEIKAIKIIQKKLKEIKQRKTLQSIIKIQKNWIIYQEKEKIKKEQQEKRNKIDTFLQLTKNYNNTIRSKESNFIQATTEETITYPEKIIKINNKTMITNTKSLLKLLNINNSEEEYNTYLKSQLHSWQNIADENKKWDLIYQTACFLILKGKPFNRSKLKEIITKSNEITTQLQFNTI